MIVTSTDRRITRKDPGFIPMVFEVPNQRDEFLLALSITGRTPVANEKHPTCQPPWKDHRDESAVADHRR